MPASGLMLEPIADEAPEAVSTIGPAVVEIETIQPVTVSGALPDAPVVSVGEMAPADVAIAITSTRRPKRLAWPEDGLVDVLSLAELEIPL